MASSPRRTAARSCSPSSGSRFPDQPGRDYPFILNTGRTVEHWHTGTKTRAVPILAGMSPRAWLEMNPRDAQRLNLKPHDHVSVISQPQPRGRGWNCVSPKSSRRARCSCRSISWKRIRIVVTQSAFDPISREPNFKQCAVKVEKSQGFTGSHESWKISS